MLPELLKQIPATEPLLSVRGDGAYDTKACYEAISSRQAAAIIPTRKNAKRWKENTAGAKARNETLAATAVSRADDMEKMERLSSTKFSRNKDALF
jgi:hypothetical protein